MTTKKVKHTTASRLITLSRGGTKEKTVEVRSIRIPDLWSVIDRLGYDTADGQNVNRCWHLCHDLLTYILNDNTETQEDCLCESTKPKPE